MSRKSLLIVLFVSLALNLFLIGTVAGGLVVGQRFRAAHPMPARVGVQPPLWRAADGLSQEQRNAYRAALRSGGPQMRDAMRQVRVARQDAWRALADEPFDAAAARRRLAEIRTQEARARGLVDDKVVDFAAGLSPAERTILVKGLTEPRGRGEPPHRR
ncbi:MULTISPECIES: periplasmic heavy metal sensor [Phenylobacterium]|uniref:Membrane protein n=1 Tax=Phenylobacterium koreense TaxID=266125 RepID=A0ABV2EEG8_9CAUL